MPKLGIHVAPLPLLNFSPLASFPVSDKGYTNKRKMQTDWSVNFQKLAKEQYSFCPEKWSNPVKSYHQFKAWNGVKDVKRLSVD